MYLNTNEKEKVTISVIAKWKRWSLQLIKSKTEIGI